MTVQDDELSKIDRSMNSIMKQLDEMELSWTDLQRTKQKERLLENLMKKRKTNDFMNGILKKCKEHNGPVTSVEELMKLVQIESPNLKTFLRLEIQFQRETHRRDAEIRSDLYKVNSLSVDEMILNLTVLLSNDPDADESVLFPCEEEIMEIINNSPADELKEASSETSSRVEMIEKNLEIPSEKSVESGTATLFEPNQPLAVIWDERNRKKWYIGFFLDVIDDGTYRVDYLDRVNHRDSKLWQRPKMYDDIQETEEIQIIPVNVIGEWDFKTDVPYFILENKEEIKRTFEKICDTFDLSIDE